jgi:hypothetical protein
MKFSMQKKLPLSLLLIVLCSLLYLSCKPSGSQTVDNTGVVSNQNTDFVYITSDMNANFALEKRLISYLDSIGPNQISVSTSPLAQVIVKNETKYTFFIVMQDSFLQSIVLDTAIKTSDCAYLFHKYWNKDYAWPLGLFIRVHEGIYATDLMEYIPSGFTDWYKEQYSTDSIMFVNHFKEKGIVFK